MPRGVLFALSAYGLYSCCDAIVKALGHGLTVYEIAFFTTLFSLVPALLTTPKGENWLRFYRLNNPRLVHLRGLSGVIGNFCVIYAFTTVPLQEVYSIAFLAPIFIVFISVVALKETVGWQRWVFLAVSFCGVLLVVKPGFRELHLGHLAAVGAAVCGAITTTALRKVSNTEMRVSLIGVASAYILIVNGALILFEGFRPITWEELVGLLAIGAIGGTGNLVFIAATRSAPASQIAPIQYSQIGWALLFGALFYNEMPDAIGFAGLVLVVGAGILNVLSGETNIRIFSRLSPGGAGPAMIKESEAADVVLEAPIAGAAEIASER